MGFPVGCTEVFLLPKFFIRLLALLGFIRNLILSLFRLIALSDILESEVSYHQISTRRTEYPPLSAVLLRELLPFVKFEDIPTGAVDLPESCAVCLYEFEAGEEIRWLSICKHIFHRSCLDRWMDHDQTTCPLCRTPFVPRGLQDEFNQRLWAASGITVYSTEYNSVSGF